MSGGALTAVGEVLGWDTALVVAFVVTADYVQFRLLGQRIGSLNDSVDNVEQRTQRLEDQFIAADGGEKNDDR